MNVINRLYLGFSLLLMLMALTAVIGVLKINKTDKLLTQVAEQTSVEQRQAINFRGSVHDRAISIRDAVLVGNLNASQKHFADIVRLDSYYQESAVLLDRLYASKENTNAEDQKLLTAIKEIEQTTIALTAQSIRLLNESQYDQATNFLLSDVSPAYTEWLKRINALIDFQEKVIQESVKSVCKDTNNFQWFMTIVTVLSLLVGTSFSILTVKKLLQILGGQPEKAADIIQQIANGDLRLTVEASTPNSVMSSLSMLNHQLNQMTGSTIKAADDLMTASNNLLNTSQNNEKLMDQQKIETEKGAAAIQQMATSVIAVAHHTNEAAGLAQTAMGEFIAGQQESIKRNKLFRCWPVKWVKLPLLLIICPKEAVKLVPSWK